MNVRPETISALLQKGIPPEQWRLYADLFQETSEDFCRSSSWTQGGDRDRGLVLVQLVRHLVNQVYLRLESIDRIGTLTTDFNRRLLKATTEDEILTHILNLAADLGATAAQIRQDKKAFKRWFGRDTIQERCTRRIGAEEYKMVFYLTCLAPIAIEALTSAPTDQETKRVWQQLELEPLLESILAHVGDERLRVAVFRCLADTLRVLPPAVRSQSVKASTLVFVYRSALERRQQVWIQTEALRLLAVLSEQSLEQALRIRLESPGKGDDIFVRRQSVLLVGEYLQLYSRLSAFLPVVIKDPSPYVRQAVPTVLAMALAAPATADRYAELFEFFGRLLFVEERHEVRAASLLILPPLMLRDDLTAALSGLLCRVLAEERHSFVLRTALVVFRESLLLMKECNRRQALEFYARTSPLLEDLHRGAVDLSVRRWAAQAINFADVHLHQAMDTLRQRLEPKVVSLGLGKSTSLPKDWFKGVDSLQIGRVLALLAEEGGGLTMARDIWGYRITKGDRFDFRFWRFLHELFHPSPDKRQAFNHTVGRIYRGKIHAPTPIMAELTQTKVPGEPLHHSTESGWRPYLPLVDQLLASLTGIFRGSVIRIFTAEGRTEIVPPARLLQRFWLRMLLTIRYPHFSRLRNWRENSGEVPSTYIGQLEDLGFRFVFSGYGVDPEEQSRRTDPAVSRFFPFLPFLFDPSLPIRFEEYIFSIYENSLYELGLFAGGLLLLFLGLRLSASRAVSRARKGIPLVVGGWGTRGKSGVERLKAALFESLGHGILSKSTGCEAMFLHAHQFGRTKEMFLFRPYDKATIWEHHNLILLAGRMRCTVFLWECMGLTPAYVDILQHRWSKDDFSTITNTYPDHEDIQGPAGYNIPQVMTCFIPKRGSLITTEEQMHPILSEDAIRKKTEFRKIGWLEAGLLTADILQRFPYEEHPYNIALVVALAERLGIGPDLALKEMADRVIPDLGVLKAFPKAHLAGRSLEFVNGMSANERFATLSNWQRMEFQTGPDGPDPGIFLQVVINNRADRISRSRMFGSILAQDIMADRYVLIGSNLAGLFGYIMTAWHEYLSERMTRLAHENDPAVLAVFLQSMADSLRIPHSDEFVRQRLGLMLGSSVEELDLGELLDIFNTPAEIERAIGRHMLPHKDEVISHAQEHLTFFREYTEIREKISGGGQSRADLHRELVALFTSWFKRRIVIIEDFHATGDQIISRLCAETPPGLHCRIMGVQNIKGTGLDFVYRWQAWERCWMSCNKLRAEDEAVFTEGLNEMMAFQDFGLLSEEYVTESVATARRHALAQTERFQAGLHLIEMNLAKKRASISGQMSGNRRPSGLRSRLLEAAEAFLDAGDAIRRRKIANAIYNDLATERISHQRAALELQALNRRQKGGWLAKK